MMEIRECDGVKMVRAFEVSDDGQLRAIFLSKEDAQRFIRNETVRREEEKHPFYELGWYPENLMPCVPDADLASLMEAASKTYEKLLASMAQEEEKPPAPDTYYKTWIGREPSMPPAAKRWWAKTFASKALDSDLPEPDAIVETK
jgi:hypothetical protein